MRTLLLVSAAAVMAACSDASPTSPAIGSATGGAGGSHDLAPAQATAFASAKPQTSFAKITPGVGNGVKVPSGSSMGF